MGSKKVCLECRLSYNRSIHEFGSQIIKLCPECGQPMKLLNLRFRPPKKSDESAWNVVGFLIENGFDFQHIYQEGSSDYIKKPKNNYVSYPTNMRDAKEFVEKYKAYARKKSD